MRHRVHVILLETRTGRVDAIQQHLAERGITVATVRSGAALITELATHRPAVAILDILDDTAPEVAALLQVPEFSKSFAVIVVADLDKPQTEMRLLELRLEDAAVVQHDLASLATAVEQCEQSLLWQSGLLRIATTILDTLQMVLHTQSGQHRLPAATCNTLAALMRAYPHAVRQKDLLANVVHFAADAHSEAVYSRIYEVREQLADARADIKVDSTRGAGYRICIIASSECAERGREREREREEQQEERADWKNGNAL